VTQPEEQQDKGRQPADEATTPIGSTPTPTATGADSEPTAAFEPTSPAAPQSPPAAPGSPAAPPFWSQPPADPAAPQSPAAPSVWGQPPADPAAPQSPAAPSVWGRPRADPAAPQSPAAPSVWGRPPASPSPAGQPPASQTPGGPAQSGVPLPPGWGQQQGQPGQPAYQPPQDPFHTTTMTPASAQLPYNPYGQLSPEGQPTPLGLPPDQMLQPPPKKKSKALLITSIVLGVVLLLCAAGGVGGFLLINNSEGKGAETAKDAAQGFLTAVYKDHDGTAAEKLVCNEARDRKAIDAKIKEIQDQKAKLKGPSITWDSPEIENETAGQANTTITIKLTTSDEKLSEQTVKLTLVKHDGWFVCEVEGQQK